MSQLQQTCLGQEGVEEVAMKMIESNEPIDKIIEYTGLTEEEIQRQENMEFEEDIDTEESSLVLELTRTKE